LLLLLVVLHDQLGAQVLLIAAAAAELTCLVARTAVRLWVPAVGVAVLNLYVLPANPLCAAVALVCCCCGSGLILQLTVA
jgi:hypothetical protein